MSYHPGMLNFGVPTPFSRQKNQQQCRKLLMETTWFLHLCKHRLRKRSGKQTLLLLVPLSLSSCSDCSSSLHLPIWLFNFHHLPPSDIHLLPPQTSPSVPLPQVSLKHSQLLRQSP